MHYFIFTGVTMRADTIWPATALALHCITSVHALVVPSLRPLSLCSTSCSLSHFRAPDAYRCLPPAAKTPLGCPHLSQLVQVLFEKSLISALQMKPLQKHQLPSVLLRLLWFLVAILFKRLWWLVKSRDSLASFCKHSCYSWAGCAAQHVSSESLWTVGGCGEYVSHVCE